MICHISFSLVFIGSVLININASVLHCVFSTYMLHFFELNELFFLDRHLEGKREVFTLDDLKKDYASILHCQHDIILVMLKEIGRRSGKSYPTDLMTVNLYLNNLTGNVINIYLSSDASGEKARTRDANSGDVSIYCRQGLFNHYKMIKRSLKHYVYTVCSNKYVMKYFKMPYTSLTVSQKKWRENKRDKSTFSAKLGYLTAMSNNANREFRQILEKEEKDYKNFHPEYMLFSGLFREYNELNNLKTTDLTQSIIEQTDILATIEENAGEELIMMTKVVVDSKCNAKYQYTIVDLYGHVILNFNANHIRSFQQQVFAASVHPIFSCISTYATAIKYINLKNNNDRSCDETLKNLGSSFLEILKNFHHVLMYPLEMSHYIKSVIEQLDDIVDITTKNGTSSVPNDKISDLLLKCSKPMILNRLKFNTQQNIEQTDENHKTLLMKCETEITRTHDYIQNLRKFEDVFYNVQMLIPHDNIFIKKPIDILYETCKPAAREKKFYSYINEDIRRQCYACK